MTVHPYMIIMQLSRQRQLQRTENNQRKIEPSHYRRQLWLGLARLPDKRWLHPAKESSLPTLPYVCTGNYLNHLLRECHFLQRISVKDSYYRWQVITCFQEALQLELLCYLIVDLPAKVSLHLFLFPRLLFKKRENILTLFFICLQMALRTCHLSLLLFFIVCQITYKSSHLCQLRHGLLYIPTYY